MLDRRNAPTTFGVLKTGDLVQVEGVARPDGSVLAAKIALEDEGNDGTTTGVQVRFAGTCRAHRR